MDEFFRTIMGRKFFDVTMPKLVGELERLNGNIEALVAELAERRRTPPPPR